MSAARSDTVGAHAQRARREDPRAGRAAAGGLLHNMSAPPKSIVSFEGLGGLARKGSPRDTGIASIGYEGQEAFGASVRFSLPESWRSLPLRDLVRAIDPECRSRTRKQLETRLLRRIDERTAELELPDGCLAVPADDSHPAPWTDGLAALAVLSRCTDTVWLREKEPSWKAGVERGAVSLLVPPAFVAALPARPSPPRRARRATEGRKRR